MHRNLLVFALLLGIAACRPKGPSGPSPADVTYAFEPLAPPRAASSQPPRFLTCRELPFGFRHDDENGPPQAAAGYPTAEDPHVVLGKVSFSMPPAEPGKRGSRWREQQDRRYEIAQNARGELLKLAASHGANAVCPAGKEQKSYWAIYISEGAPPPGQAPDALLKEVVAEGFVEIDRKTWALDGAYGDMPIAAKRGRCYAMGFAMTENARRERGKIGAGLGAYYKRLSVTDTGKTVVNQHVMGLFGDKLDGLSRRAGFQELFCALADEAVTVTLRARDPQPLGAGDMVFTLHERKLPPAEATKLFCDACAPRQLGCGSIVRGSCAQAVTCLSSFGMKASQCKDE